ncbi:glycosyltransferase family 4 protein [Polaribacter marinivivus]|uniref:glycosyltransferase family 4 protein n=1 Tax=Polaribacter marinivivus TaxID=1524260 RepID=UPI003D3284B6
MKEWLIFNDLILLCISVGVFLITLFVLPRIRKTALKFNLMDSPNQRSSHDTVVPTFGGVAFYITLVFTLFITQLLDTNDITISLLVSLTIIFFVGLKDDFHELSPKMKFLGQVVTVLILMSQPEFLVYSLHGFFGIQEIHPIISIIFSSFLFLGFINAFNLIDGIDGFASITGIVIAGSYGLLFHSIGNYYFLAICVAVISMLFAFLRFNFSSKKKIFMGDTGSLLIGTILGLLTMKLLSLGGETYSALAIYRKEIPLLILCILIIPTFDIARVIYIRVTQKKSIFSADRNHIHHVLIDAGLSHKQASLLIGIINILIVVSMYFSIKYFGIGFSLLLFFVIILSLIYTFFVMNKTYFAKKKKVKFRNFLINCLSTFSLKHTANHNNYRLLLKQKIRSFRIFFF